MFKKLFVSILTIILLSIGGQTQTDQIHPDLELKLQKLKKGEKLAVIVELKEQVKLNELVSMMSVADRRQKTRAVVHALQNLAEKHQEPLRTYLKKQTASGAAKHVIPYWIFNGFAVTATEPVIRHMAALSDVREIRLDSIIPMPSPTPTAAEPSAGASEWNIGIIRAPEVWDLNPAYNGSGAVVGSFDTGVTLSHPDLYSRYRGNHQISWFDPYNEHATPYDFYGHGTHTTGTMVGGNAGGSYIGVAPGAKWIAAKGFNDDGVGEASAFHQIFQWFLAPGGDPDNAPDVVNCSWAFADPGCDLEFEADIQACRAAGIFPSFSSGNDGPAPGSVRSPAAYPISFAVGATDPSDQVVYFTGRGPSPCDGSIKPNISAPGDGIISAYLFDYAIMSGTSMAAPHVSGAVAVLRSINPNLSVEQLEAALNLGAKDISAPGPDNDSGAGRMDLFVSAQIAILGPDFPVVKAIATEPVATEAGPTPGTITISRTGNTSDDLEVEFTISGSAISGEDYIPIPESVTIPSGSESATLQITPIDDLLAEWDETVTITIISDSAYIVSGSNTATITIQSDELISDLRISSMTAPITGGAGQTIIITETTMNQGEGSADPSTTQFYFSTNSSFDATDTLIGSRSVPVLASGASDRQSTTLTIPASTEIGGLYILAKADGEEVVVETSENNNIYARYISIGPDMRIINLSAPISTGPGQNISVTETTKNNGGGDADPTLTQFYLSLNSSLDESDTPLGSRNIPALASGASDSGSTTVMIPEDAAVGNWYLLAMADSEEVVIETSEGNNTYARTIKIGADMRISSLSVPSTAGPGESINVTDTTMNQGGAAAEPSMTHFYLSTNSSFDASDTLLGSRNIPALAAGASSAGSTTITLPGDSIAGSCYIIAKADGEDVVAETTESNNTYARLIKIGTDLSITTMSIPTTAGPGQNITVTETTKNQGGAAADPSTTQFYLSTNSSIDASDTLLGSRNVPALAAGASSAGSTSVTIPEDTASGNWYIMAKADGEDAVIETSETNNTYARLIKVGTDLRITSFSVPATAGAGQNISVTDTTKNQGGGPAEPSTTQFYLSTNSSVDASDILLGGRSVPALAAGASNSGTTSIMIPVGTNSGSWYIVAKADGEDVVIETSETNNTYARLIKVGTDLRITSFSVPATAGAGQNISVTDTTKNQGGGPAEPSTTQFYLSTNSSVDASDILLGGRSVPALAVGASNSGSTTLTIPVGTAAGGWYIVAKADGEDVVIETSETNNTYARFIKIGPDLRVLNLSAPLSVSPGQSISVTETTENQGGGFADPTTTQFYLSTNTSLDASDILLGSRSIPALAAGASNNGMTTVTIPADTTSGAKYILAIADGEDVVAEVYETNNKYARYIKIN